MTAPGFRLLAIGDRRQATPEAVAAAADAGGAEIAILLREPGIQRAEAARWADRLLPLCRATGASLLVHRWTDTACDVGAHGVHLPDDGSDPAAARRLLGPAALVGTSRHDAAGLAAAARAGASYATLSPVFPTPDKGAPLGLAALAAACAAAPLPIAALGGVGPARARACRRAGASAVAAVRGVWEGDPAANVRLYLAGWAESADSR